MLTWAACAVVGVIIALIFQKYRGRDRSVKTYSKYVERQFGESHISCVVSDPEEVEEMFAEIQKYTDFMFGFRPTKPIEVQLVPSQELYRMTLPYHGKTFRPDGLCSNKDGEVTIYIRLGLPRDQFYSVLAHEYAHAWQIMDRFMGGSTERKEGFAEWVAYAVTELAGYDAVRLFERPPWDPYGSGMYKFQVIAEHYGFHGAVRAGKSSRLNLKALRPPPGPT